jgi:hypothetical protein
MNNIVEYLSAKYYGKSLVQCKMKLDPRELNELTENADIVRFIKSRRIPWLGYVMRMGQKRTLKRVLVWKLIGRRIRGRPRKRWIEDVEEDIQRMGIRGWRKLCKERTEWKKITEKAKTHDESKCNAMQSRSRKLRFPYLMTTAQDGSKVVSLTHRPHLPPGNTPGTQFC